ncbi:hypothetical protein BT69DRAFT_1283644, partial [Atractiella rhizophila]
LKKRQQGSCSRSLVDSFPIANVMSSEAGPVFQLPPGTHVGGSQLLASLLGGFISCLMLGVILQLSGRYFRYFKGKRFFMMKAVVLFVACCETTFIITIILRLCLLHAIRWGDFVYIMNPGDRGVSMASGITSVLLQSQCQLFLCYRGWQISKIIKWRRLWLNITLSLTLFGVVVGFVLGLSQTIIAVFHAGVIHRTNTYAAVLLAWLSLSLAVDFSLCFFLIMELRHVNKSLISPSSRIRFTLDNAIMFIIYSGLLILSTQLVTLGLAIWEHGQPVGSSQWSLLFLVLLPSIYAFSFLVILLGSQLPSGLSQKDVESRELPERTEATNRVRPSSTMFPESGYTPGSPALDQGVPPLPSNNRPRTPPDAPTSTNFGMGRGISKYFKNEKNQNSFFSPTNSGDGRSGPFTSEGSSSNDETSKKRISSLSGRNGPISRHLQVDPPIPVSLVGSINEEEEVPRTGKALDDR